MKERCLQQKTGSCLGCPIIDIGIRQVRWSGKNPASINQYLKEEYCPVGTFPQVEKAINKDASYGLGQDRTENLDVGRQTGSSTGFKYKI